jgi:hypothetical protein
MTKGMMKSTLTLFNAKGNQNVIRFSGTSRVDSLTLSQFVSDTNSTTAPPIIEITSTTSSGFTFGNNSFSYSNSANKSASVNSCGILCNSSSSATVLFLVYNVFSLGGTDTSGNYVVNHGAIPCITFFFSNSATVGNAHEINGNFNSTKFTLQSVA